MITAESPVTPGFVYEYVSDSPAHISENLVKVFSEHPVVVIRNQRPATIDELKSIAKKFGKLFTAEKNKTYENYHVDTDGQVLKVSNAKDNNGKPTGVLGNSEVGWHSDLSHLNSPFEGSLLYNCKNAQLANLYFCDSRSLLSAIPEKIRNKAKKLIGLHSLEKNTYKLEEEISKPLVGYTKNATNTTQSLARKPVVRSDAFQQDCLYISPATLIKFETRFSPRLFLKYIEPSMVYQHRWQPNDIVIYNNVSTMHRRDEFEGDRLLYRINFDFQNC